MNYPEGLSSRDFCHMEGHAWGHGGTCHRCGAQLRCLCGRFVRIDGIEAHIDSGCPSVLTASGETDG